MWLDLAVDRCDDLQVHVFADAEWQRLRVRGPERDGPQTRWIGRPEHRRQTSNLSRNANRYYQPRTFLELHIPAEPHLPYDAPTTTASSVAGGWSNCVRYSSS